MFAYGHPGFSNLQEYMIFDRWVDTIQPDLVVWQVCSNDFIDNYAPLEMICGYKVGERRPYLGADGRIFYQRPLSLWQKIKERIHFYAWLEKRWIFTKKNLFGIEHRHGEYYISHEERKFRPFAESVEVTRKIFRMINDRRPENVKIIGFPADSFRASNEAFEELFSEHDFEFTTSPPHKVDSIGLKIGKEKLKAKGGWHWNELGHQVIANALIPYIKKEIMN